jgi:hypothetical protein
MTVNKFSASVPIEDARVGLDLVRVDHEVVLAAGEADVGG